MEEGDADVVSGNGSIHRFVFMHHLVGIAPKKNLGGHEVSNIAAGVLNR
jgi:hypothetical protein